MKYSSSALLPCEGPSDAVGPSTLYSSRSALILSLFDVHFAESVGLKPICPPLHHPPQGLIVTYRGSGVNSLAGKLSDVGVFTLHFLWKDAIYYLKSTFLKIEVFEEFAYRQNIQVWFF